MTVEIAFRPDPHEASKAEATDPLVLFRETLLVVPIRLLVNGRDVLPVRRSNESVWKVDPSGTAQADAPRETEVWNSQPVIGFLVGLRDGIAEAQVAGRSSIYMADGLDIVVAVRDSSTIQVGSGTVALQEFVAALNAFERSVRSWLEVEAPQLMAHPSWPEWFPSKGMDVG